MALTSPGEPCLVDVDVADDRTSLSSDCVTYNESSLSSHRAEFTEAVFDRDGEACLVTGDYGPYCDACHMIPHSKGSDVRIRQSYFASFLTMRSIYQDSSAHGVQHTVLLKKWMILTTHAMDFCSPASSTVNWRVDLRLF